MELSNEDRSMLSRRVDQLADTFINVIRCWLPAETCHKVDQLNRAEVDANICHTHTFIDANQAMEQAYLNMWGEKPDLSNEDVMGEWGDAWMLAKARGFAPDPPVKTVPAKLVDIEGELRSLSVDLWTFTVDDPETATVDSEAEGMTPERYERREIMDRLTKLADQVEAIVQGRLIDDLLESCKFMTAFAALHTDGCGARWESTCADEMIDPDGAHNNVQPTIDKARAVIAKWQGA